MSEEELIPRPMVIKADRPWLREKREGKGFSLSELEKAGITIEEAKRLGIPVDKRRRTCHEWNVEVLKKSIDRLRALMEKPPSKERRSYTPIDRIVDKELAKAFKRIGIRSCEKLLRESCFEKRYQRILEKTKLTDRKLKQIIREAAKMCPHVVEKLQRKGLKLPVRIVKRKGKGERKSKA